MRCLQYRLSHLSESFGAQLALYSPLLLICLLVALFGSIRKAFQNRKICLFLRLHLAPSPQFT